MAYTAYLVQRGNRITYTNSTGSDIGSKQVVVVRSGSSGRVGITEIAVANGATGPIAVGGGDERVWNLPKKSGDVFALGSLVYWDATNSRLTTTASGNTLAGYAAAAAASAATTADIVLNG